MRMGSLIKTRLELARPAWGSDSITSKHNPNERRSGAGPANRERETDRIRIEILNKNGTGPTSRERETKK